MARGLDRQRLSGERADARRADVHDIHDADLNYACPHHVNVQRAELHPADLHDIHVLNDGRGHDFDRIVDRHQHLRLVSLLPSGCGRRRATADRNLLRVHCVAHENRPAVGLVARGQGQIPYTRPLRVQWPPL
ncbi:MAG: hypothetical protein ACLP01_00745 [Solirubrobacteraceae bacterium]